MEPEATNSREVLEQKASEREHARYVLTLYITGATPQSTSAILNIKRVCEEQLEGRYELEVVDIYQQPALAQSEQIVAAPTLIKKLPLPLRRLVGNMSNEEGVLAGLGLSPS